MADLARATEQKLFAIHDDGFGGEISIDVLKTDKLSWSGKSLVDYSFLS